MGTSAPVVREVVIPMEKPMLPAPDPRRFIPAVPMKVPVREPIKREARNGKS